MRKEVRKGLQGPEEILIKNTICAVPPTASCGTSLLASAAALQSVQLFAYRGAILWRGAKKKGPWRLSHSQVFFKSFFKTYAPGRLPRRAVRISELIRMMLRRNEVFGAPRRVCHSGGICPGLRGREGCCREKTSLEICRNAIGLSRKNDPIR